MAHNSRVRGSADTWLNILPAELASLDAYLRGGINDTDGGFWAPASPIVISGATGGLLMVGPTAIARGGSLTTGNVLGTVFLQDNDYPLIDQVTNTAHANRSILYPFHGGRGEYPQTWLSRREDGGMQAFASSFDLSDGKGIRPASLFLKIRGHDAATLKSITITFRVSTPHASLPAIMPAARVYTIDNNGNFAFCTSAASGADAFGFVYVPAPSSATAWFNGGAVQTLTIPIDQNNVCSTGTKEYILQVVDEQGLTGWPYQLLYTSPVRLCMTANQGLLNPGAGTIDGVSYATNDRILLTAQTNGTENGIWIASTTGNWTRSLDLNQSAQYQRGMVVPVTSGNVLGGLYLQASTLVGSWNRGNSSDAVKLWTNATALSAFGAGVQPTVAHYNGYWYQGVGTGTPVTGGTEPIWPTNVGASIVDNAGANQITWTCMGTLPTVLGFDGHPDQGYADDSGGLFLAHGTIWHAALATFGAIQDFRPQ